MSYPLTVEINLIQEDFIEVEMLENILDAKDVRKEFLRTFMIQSVVSAIAAMGILFNSFIMKETLYFILFFWVIFALNFGYNYFIGYKNELNLTLQHLVVSNQKGNTFFLEEQGFVNLYEDKGEYLTNEQRRYFDYSSISSIKITKRLFIFVMKRSKERNMRGFCYMIVPKRDLSEDKLCGLCQVVDDIKARYSISEWIGKTIFD
ncbi:MAG: YcxB family protein [Oscillospiraceae bacterium]